jgi:hypothetical protein
MLDDLLRECGFVFFICDYRRLFTLRLARYLRRLDQWRWRIECLVCNENRTSFQSLRERLKIQVNDFFLLPRDVLGCNKAVLTGWQGNASFDRGFFWPFHNHLSRCDAERHDNNPLILLLRLVGFTLDRNIGVSKFQQRVEVRH